MSFADLSNKSRKSGAAGEEDASARTHIGATWARVKLGCPWAPHFRFTLESAENVCKTTADGLCVSVREVCIFFGVVLVVTVPQNTCHKRDGTGVRLLEIALLTGKGTICHRVPFSEIHVVIFSFEGSCCVSLCGNDSVGGSGVRLRKKKCWNRIFFVLS